MKCAFSPHPGTLARGAVAGRLRARAGGIHCGTVSLAGWPDAAYGGQLAENTCRLEFLGVSMSSSRNGPCRNVLWASKFTRQLVKNSLGGEVHVFSEMFSHVSFSGNFANHSRICRRARLASKTAEVSSPGRRSRGPPRRSTRPVTLLRFKRCWITLKCVRLSGFRARGTQLID